MRLASVGEVTESFSDMLLCPALRTGVYRSEGDVFVTNALRNSLNVLTSDFLFHRAPVLVRPRQGTLAFRASALQIGAGFSYVPTELVGGAPCVRVRVGGAELRMLVDSGASACAAVNPQVKLEGRPQRQHVTQLGVHGEHVCSAVLLADVELAGTTLRDVPVFQNRAALAHADGYVGLGILRTFDWVVLPDAFGFRNNGLGTQDGYAFSDGEC